MKGDVNMPQYVMVYLGGNQSSNPEEAKRNMARYRDWLASLGDAAVSPANPFKDTHTVSPGGDVIKGSSVFMSGYTIVKAKSIKEALELAKACPFLETGGSMEVSELMDMGGN
jgi:hypothetical protein